MRVSRNIFLLLFYFSICLCPVVSHGEHERPDLDNWWSSVSWPRNDSQTASIEPGICRRALEAFSRGTARVVDATVTTLGHTMRAFFYPIYLGGQMLTSSPQIFSTPGLFAKSMGSYLRRTSPHALGYLGLLLLSKNVMTPWRVIESATSDFDPATDDDVVVVVIGNPPDTGEGKMFQNYAKRLYPNHPKLVFIYPEDYVDLVDHLKEISERQGKISRLDFLAHGFKGGSMISPDETLTTSHLKKLTPQKGIFDSQAKVRFFGCLTGSGKEGKQFLETFGNVFLDEGGTVVASRRLSATPLTALLPPEYWGPRLENSFSVALEYGAPFTFMVPPLFLSFSRQDFSLMFPEELSLVGPQVVRVNVRSR